jgi:chromate transporter
MLSGDKKLEVNPMKEPFLPKVSTEAEQGSMSLSTLIGTYFFLGLTTYEGPDKDRIIHREKLIDQKGLYTEREYSFFEALWQTFPGHTSTQILVSLAILRTKSVLYGLVGLLAYYLPSMIMIILIASLLSALKFDHTHVMEKDTKSTFFYWLTNALMGICQASIAVLISNAIYHIGRFVRSPIQVALLIAIFIIAIMTNSFTIMMVLIILSGVVCTLQATKENEIQEEATEIRTDDIKFIGWPSFVTYIAIFLILGFLFAMYHDSLDMYIINTCYLIGTFSFTGAFSLLPLFLQEFGGNIIPKIDIIRGYGITALLPGPMPNLAAYIGTFANSFITGVLALIFTILPGLLLMMFALPYYKTIKSNMYLQNFLVGLAIAGLGIVLSAIYTIFYEVCVNKSLIGVLLSTLNVVICYMLLSYYKLRTPFVLLIGAVIYCILVLFV